MPRAKLTKSLIDALPTPQSDSVYWDSALPGFGVKVTPKGRKVFLVLYRTGGAGSKLRKYTIGPYGRVTLHQARVAAQKVFAARLEGRDPAAEKRERKRQIVADRVEDLLETFINQRLSQNRSGPEIARLLRREIGKAWAGRSIHEIGKRDVVEVISAIEQRGAPVAANKALKSIKTFMRWCVGRAILDQSPAEGVPAPAKEVARDRVLSDHELARVILAARQVDDRYGGIVELLALTGQRREEVARQHLPGDEAWLIGEHRASGEKKYYLANLPAATSLRTLAATIKARWICEQAHQQLKEELGLDHFEGRSWQGLHRHALMTMIAFAFLQHRRLKKVRREKKNQRTAASTKFTGRASRHRRTHRSTATATLPALPKVDLCKDAA